MKNNHNKQVKNGHYNWRQLMEAISLIYKVKKHHSQLWIDANNQLKAYIAEDFKDKIDKQDLLANKTELINILQINAIYSQQDFINRQIFEVDSTSHLSLSYAQQRLWFIEQFEGGTNAYHIPMLLKLSSDINCQQLFWALQTIVKRHTVLTTLFHTNEQGLDYQVICDEPLSIESMTVTNQQAFDDQISQTINQPFNLRHEYPIRVIYIDFNQHHFPLSNPYLLINIHHIAFDGWSIDIFLKELTQIYDNLQYNKQAQSHLPSLSIQYKDFAVWQRSYLSNILQQQINFWQQQLANLEPLALPTDYPRPNQFEHEGNHIEFTLDSKRYQQLQQLAQQQGCTLYTILLSGFYLVLYHYTSQQDLVVGTPLANRHYPEVQDLIGFFVNALPIRQILDTNQSAQHLIQQLHQHLIDIQSYQDIPFEHLVQSLEIEQDPSRHPIFQVIFSVQDFSDQQYDLFSLETTDPYYQVAKFDLEAYLSLQPTSSGTMEIKGYFHYATALFEQQTIERLAKHYTYILDQLIQQPKQVLSDYQVLTPQAYQQIVFDWNRTQAYPQDQTLNDLFEQQANQTPHKSALVFQDQSLTYQQLNKRANQLARVIRQAFQQHYGYHLPPETLIGLFLERSLDIVIAILGVLKAGGAYVPIDPEYPQDRIQYVLQDSQCPLVLTQAHHQITLQTIAPQLSYSINTIALDRISYQSIAADNLHIDHHANNLAYVIYTSGTTGKPKGVMQPHSNVTRLLTSTQNLFNFNDSDVWTLFHSYIFDFSVWEIWGALIYGGQLIIPDYMQTRDTLTFIRLCEQHGITVLNQTPSAFYQLADNLEYSNKALTQLRYVILGGEALNTKQLTSWWHYTHKHAIQTQLINMYGITETTVHATYKVITPADTVSSNMGRPLADLKAYVLNPNQQPVPIGVIGELYIGGAGLARGYLNREQLTQQKFINNPFATYDDIAQGQSKLYKTGDLVRWLPDGNLEYIGRNDFQVKIRGFRIELGEIENSLLTHPKIDQVYVIASNMQSNPYLIAYYVYRTDTSIQQDDLITHLLQFLPSYMIPSYFMPLHKLPLNINGKLDRQALPTPDITTSRSSQQYVAPQTELQAKICQIWQDILALEHIGIHDDFFRIGGNSILAIQLSHQLSKHFDSQISVADIFKYQTITQLADFITDNQGQQILIPQYNRDAYPLSYAQERLWFIEQYEQGTNAYHIPLLLRLSDDVNWDQLAQALEIIVNRHTILRTIFRVDHLGQDYQIICEQNLPIQHLTSDNEDVFDQQVEQAINQPFDLRHHYPIRVVKYHVKSNSQDPQAVKTRLLINIHHIAFDGWSVDIFLKELIQIYTNLQKNRAPQTYLPELNIQYQDYALWQRQYLEGEVLQRQIDYWQKQLADLEPLALPTDFSRPSKIDYHGQHIQFSLDQTLSAQLNQLAQDQGCTLYTILLSGFYILLHKYTSQQDLVIGTPIANRHYAQIEDLIGFFVNSLPIRHNIDPYQNALTTIQQLHQHLIEVQSYQDVPFEHLVQALEIEHDPSRHPIFQVMFGLQEFGQQAKKTDLFDLEPIESSYEVAKFDLEAYMTSYIDNSGRLQLDGHINYVTALFERSTMERFTQHYQHLLQQLVDQPNQAIKDYAVLTSSEHNQIIYQWNNTAYPYPTQKTVHELFEQQVDRTPDKIAVVSQYNQLTYQQLNQKANQLARSIIKLGGNQQANSLNNSYNSTPQTPIIALFLDRDVEMIISMLAVMKAGAAYVPIDPNYPQDRVQYILQDTATHLVLTHDHYERDLAELTKQASLALTILPLDQAPYQLENSANLTHHTQANDLAYVIYTSGTTGQPKGIMMPHQSLVNRALYMAHYAQITSNDFYLFKTNYVFDVSISDIFSHILAGAKLYISYYNFDVDELMTLLSQYPFTSLPIVPSQIVLLTQALNQSSVQKIYFCGEALQSDYIDNLSDQIELFNYYGPAETGEITVYKPTYGSEHNMIGRPFNNVTCYVLDCHLNPVPIGVTGELYLGGICLAQGYINRAELTQQSFIPNPYATEQDKRQGHDRIYKTGDLVRWLPDGNIEYIGRNDFQIKIRGFRIELSEIENALVNHPDIKQACVLAQQPTKNEDKQPHTQHLVAYYVTDTSQAVDESQLITHLEHALPDYMVPSCFIHMHSFPLTVNGKLNRQALPQPDIAALNATQFVNPENQLQSTICQIWQNILDLNEIGIEDNFFRIGGNSILAIQLAHQLSHQFNIKLSVADIFRFKQVRTQAQMIAGAEQPSVIKPLAGNSSNPKLFFIHPANGGCEVYQGLAEQYAEQHYCIGIDNYNINSDYPIDNLQQLSSFYLQQIQQHDTLHPHEPLTIIGWSLGGQIALEIAAKMEEKGFYNLKVILLDSILPDPQLKQLRNQLNNEKIDNKIKHHLQQQGYDNHYINRVLKAHAIERQMINEPCSSTIQYSSVHLYKALASDDRFNDEPHYRQLENYIFQLSDNNISSCCHHPITIKRINCHHSNIIDTIQQHDSLIRPKVV